MCWLGEKVSLQGSTGCCTVQSSVKARDCAWRSGGLDLQEPTWWEGSRGEQDAQERSASAPQFPLSITARGGLDFDANHKALWWLPAATIFSCCISLMDTVVDACSCWIAHDHSPHLDS